MKPVYKRNISPIARWVSTIAGAALAVAGYQRLSRPVRFLGLGLIARGVSGWCPVTAATDYGSDAFDDQTKRHLGGSRGIIVQDAITIYRPVDEVYAYWRNLENLPRFMDHLEDVRIIDRLRSHWVARGPLGVLVEWDADIINDIPPTLLSWKSVGRSDIATAGSVRFKAEGPNETLVQVKLQYDPPAGKVGQKVASLLGEDPQLRIAQNLLQFKLLLEDGLTGTATGYRAAPESQHVRRDFDPDLEPLH